MTGFPNEGASERRTLRGTWVLKILLRKKFLQLAYHFYR